MQCFNRTREQEFIICSRFEPKSATIEFVHVDYILSILCTHICCFLSLSLYTHLSISLDLKFWSFLVSVLWNSTKDNITWTLTTTIQTITSMSWQWVVL
ncbi:hypothetical protein KP509_19G001200 [Ceratopteris richardii]|uniref:Uncharacterized protein n=1 Tax=Ceratopteris richardii TaxID=49495 RepID=A0A8T2SHI6_CERRI|nr:hypothetical protein KP509_19G001200 [Ceratopteris richardii]